MNGVVKVDFANFLTVGLIAFIFIYVANWSMRRFGLERFVV